MIDFRYLLTTIVAIFLALAIGLLIGSGLLADELAEDLERQVQETIDRNNDLRRDLGELGARIDADDDFGLQLESRWLEGELAGDEIVLFRFEGTDDGLVDRVTNALQVAGASVPTTITITERISMSDASAVEALREDLDEVDVQAEDDLAEPVGEELGERAAADANAAGDEVFPLIQRVLEDNGFISVDASRDVAIPLASDFVVVAGAPGEAPYDIAPFAEGLLTGLSAHASEVVAVEGWQSEWNFVPGLRESDVRDLVSTVDHGDTAAGTLSMVHELDRILGNDPGHYGFRGGSDSVAPETLPGE